MSLASFIVANGLRPPVQPAQHVLGPKWFTHDIVIPDGTTADINLRTNTVLASEPSLKAMFGDLDTNADLKFHIEAVEIKIWDEAWAAATMAEKRKLLEGIYLYGKKGSAEMSESLRDHITEQFCDQFVTFDSDGTDAIVQRGQVKGALLMLDKPWTLDINVDQLAIKTDVAYPSGPIDASFRWFGVAAHKDVAWGEIEFDDGSKVSCEKGGMCHEDYVAFDRQFGGPAARLLNLGR